MNDMKEKQQNGITKTVEVRQFFMESSDYYDAPIDKVLHFIWGVGLLKG
jgi:uncharacterized phage-associated protein